MRCLYNGIKEEASRVSDIFRNIAEEVSEVDDKLRAITSFIDSHNCETAEEFDDLVAEIREMIVSVQGRLFR